MGDSAGEPTIEAWRSVVSADASGEVRARIDARLLLTDVWLDLGAIGPAQELLREIERLAPEHPAAFERRAVISPRAAHPREAAQQLAALARRRPSVSLWESAVRAWIRADDVVEATASVESLQRFAPTEPKVTALALAVARLRSGTQRGATLVAQLSERASTARQHDERDTWRALSLDAWLESQGTAAGDTLAEALAATGHPRAAVYVAIESAARTLFDGGDDSAPAEVLLLRAAHLAESSGMPGEATAAWSVATLLGGERAREARESLRDQLAERGRVIELSVRLRADARRAAVNSRAAAWKGVAAVEMPVAAGLAAQALLHALALQPDDREAFELLRALAADALAAEAIRDGLWAYVRADDTPGDARTRALLWLAELEETAGDAASAAAAWAAVDEPIAAAFEGLARVHPRAEELATRAEAALAAVATAAPDTQGLAVERLLTMLGSTPGAFREFRAFTRLLGPHATGDGRVARLWMQVAVRQGDAAQRLAVARSLATSCVDQVVRQRAVFACIDAMDGTDDLSELIELVAHLLDERPQDPILAATFAAIAEHAADPALAREAIGALARAAADPWERDVLARFAHSPAGVFEVFAACLAEPSASVERSAYLARLHDLVGDSAQLLALRTRVLLAQSGAVEEGLAVAQSFAAFDPLSAEAAIAWFGAASLAGDTTQLARAAAAVTASLATHRDIAAVTRTAIARLAALDALPQAGELALAAAATGALVDRGLRSTVSDLAARLDPSSGARLFEALDAAADAPAERLQALRALADRYHASGLHGAELCAWKRVAAIAPAEALAALVRLAPIVGDRAWNAQLLAQQLDATLELSARRTLLLAIASEYAHAAPPRTVDAMAALDRLAFEQRDLAVRERVVRAMLELAQTDAAIGRLTRWAAEQPDAAAVSSLLLRAARLAHEGLGDPLRALALLRGLLRRDPARIDALEYAETIAVRAHAPEAMLGIYVDLLDRAAGPHGRRALHYRRAVFRERVGALEAALSDYVTLFDAQPAIGAAFAAIERLAPDNGRDDLVLRVVERLALTASSGTARARMHVRAGAIARERLGDTAEAMRQVLRAHQADAHVVSTEAVRAAVRNGREANGAIAQEILEALVDEQLARGNQCWEDDERRACALRALDIGLRDGADSYRVAAAIGLFLRQHPHPAEGRAEVRAAIERLAPSEFSRTAALDAPALRVPLPESVGTSEVGTSEVGTSEVGTSEVGTSEVGTSEVGTSEVGTSEVGTSEVGTSEVGTSEVGTSEVGTSEVGTPSRDSPASGRPRESVPSEPAPVRPSTPQIVDASLAALRAAASHGNDAAASVLASRLSASDDLREEALRIQRRRFQEDPARLDALEAMVSLHRSLRRTSEMAALTQVLLVLQGRSDTVVPPELATVAEPPDGVARVLFPARLGPFPELGALLWEALGSTVSRRSRERVRAREATVATSSMLGRSFAAAIRLLQLPRGTSLALLEEAPEAWELHVATMPPSLVLAADATADAERLRWILGVALESSRAGHLPITVLAPEECDAWVRAAALAFGPPAAAKPSPTVAALAARLVDGIPARAQRRMQDLVAELGPRLEDVTWRAAVGQCCAAAGMLVSGSFAQAARELTASAPDAREPIETLITHWEPLREIARFATSEEYLLLRWQVDGGLRRRR